MNLIKATACAALMLALNPMFAQEYGADESQISTVVYVSSSAGDDSNDGSMKSPLKTFAKIPKENARILLKKGDVFYEPLSGLSNCVVDSYGKGSKYPEICGLKLLKNPDAWEDMGNGVWRLDMNKTENFYGRNLEITKGNFQLNNLGALYDAASDTVYGHKVKKLEMLEKDWDITTGEIYKPKDIDAESYRWLYVKHDKNPSSDGAKLGILTYGNGVSGLKNCTVRNIAIKGFGRHGLTGSFGGKVENVKIDLIGGSTQVGYRTWVRLGNGIEFWISGSPSSNNRNHVSGCTISRTYDCGSTIQGIVEKGEIVASDITFTGNKFYRCRQAFEHFLSNRSNGRSEYINCHFEGNFAWEMGENEFSTPEPRDNNFLTYDNKRKGMIIKNNVCYGSGIYAGTRGWAEHFGENTFYVEQGKHNLLFVYPWNKQGIEIPSNSEADIQKYRETLGDTTSKIILVPEAEIAETRSNLMKEDFKYVKKFLKRGALSK